VRPLTPIRAALARSRRILVKFVPHVLYSVCLAGAVALVSSCGDRTATGPTVQVSASRVSRDSTHGKAAKVGGKRGGLMRCTVKSEDDDEDESESEAESEAESELLGPEGGTIGSGRAKLVIPRGSLTDTVTITMEVIGDTVRAVRLLPQGLVFQSPAYLTLSYSDCQSVNGRPKRIAYTSDAWTILEYEQSRDDAARKEVTGELNHFSNYAVAW